MHIHELTQDLRWLRVILYLAGQMLQLVQRMQTMGVIFFRYRVGIFQVQFQRGLIQVRFWQGTYFPAL